ncbi:uncharacterized protein LOC126821034 [Patella vulgata]|uniref:uncharacterized protein LOC126821034 n=1 Tax=Patella vulgata TaxID=6465 RepID=UPI0024A983B6|nr:uncharacterized protein LOC126821034 [Patella vulgata]
MTKHVIVIITKDVIVVPLGETVILPMNVLAYPLPVFTWYYHQHDGSNQPVTTVTGARSKQKDDGLSSTLTIHKIRYEDGGIYTVNITNSQGVTSKTYTLSVISNEDAVKEAVDDKLRIGIAIGFGNGLVVSGMLFVIIWCIKKRRDAIKSNDRNGVNDTVSPQSRDNTIRHSSVDTGDSGECENGVNGTVGSQSSNITTRPWNSPVDTDDSGEYVNTRRESRSSYNTTRPWNSPVDTGDSGEHVKSRRDSRSSNITTRPWNSPVDTGDSGVYVNTTRRDSRSSNITTRPWNSSVDTGDSGARLNSRRDSRTSFCEVLGELTKKHQSNIYLPMSDQRQGR